MWVSVIEILQCLIFALVREASSHHSLNLMGSWGSMMVWVSASIGCGNFQRNKNVECVFHGLNLTIFWHLSRAAANSFSSASGWSMASILSDRSRKHSLHRSLVSLSSVIEMRYSST